MEGTSITSSKLRFIESKKKFRVGSQVENNNTIKLITSANNHGLFIIACEDFTVKAAPIDLIDFQGKQETVNLTQFKFVIQLTFKPSLISVARYGFSSVLLVCGQNQSNQCPVVEAYDLDTQGSIGRQELPELGNCEIVDYAWHPNYFDSIVALCTSTGCLLTFGINRKTRSMEMLFNDSVYGALTCCWSPKGKNLAIGLINGKILRLEPIVTTESFTYKEVDKSVLTFNHIKPDHRVTKLRWITKTFLLSMHSRPFNPAGPETISSLITVKPAKPFLYWTNLILENQNLPNYIVHLVNLSNSVFCLSNASGEAGVIGVDGAKEAKTSELNEWHSIIVDEEGARIELPLDANNRETYPMGITTAFINNNIDQPIVMLYTSDGVICSYLANHVENILKLPEFQQPQDCPVALKAPPPVPQQQNIFSNMMSSFSLSGQQKPQATSWASLSTQPIPQLPSAQLMVQSKQAFGQLPVPVLRPVSGADPRQQQPLSLSTKPQLQPQPQAQPPQQAQPAQQQQPQPGLSQFSTLQPQLSAQLQAQQPITSLVKPQLQSLLKSQPQDLTPQLPKPPLQTQPQIQNQCELEIQPQQLLNKNQVKPSLQQSEQNLAIIKKFKEEIAAIKKGIKSNEDCMTHLDEVNSLRTHLDEIQDIHNLHQEALCTVKEDVDFLDLGMLENLYLIEFVKKRSTPLKKCVHPLVYKKVEALKVKSNLVSRKLRELESHIEVTWEQHIRRNALENKNRKINSVDIVYKTLYNNQKIIKALKDKVAGNNSNCESKHSMSVSNDRTCSIPAVNPSKVREFREYLSLRDVAPVRRP